MTDMKRCPSTGLATFFNECVSLKPIMMSSVVREQSVRENTSVERVNRQRSITNRKLLLQVGPENF